MPAAPGDTTHFKLAGRHDWDGTLADGKLTFRRLAKAAEMDHNAPEWARTTVEGKLEWRLELEPRFICGTPYLRGKWFPGMIRYREAQGSGSAATGNEATLAGDGKPIPMTFARLPPAIMGVVVLEDQTGGFSGGVAYYPYPFPGPPVAKLDPEINGSDEFNPFAFSLYSQEAEIYDSNRLSQYSRAPNGRLYIPNQTRTLFVYGQGLPRNWKAKLNVKGVLGATGLSYHVAALDSDKASYRTPVDAARCEALRDGKPLLDYYERKFALGRCAALKDIVDPAVRDLIARADAMLVTVDFDPTVLPGYKDFKVDDIGGNTRWPLRFGDDRALVSFGRDVQGDTDLVDYVFLPERTFVEIKTEVALPLDQIPVRVQLNDKLVTWNGAETLIAKRLPADPSGRTYRTATIELVEPGKPHGPADPGVMFLTVNTQDELMARPDDGGLLRTEDRAAMVLRTPALLGMTWKEALARAAKVAKSDVTDWDNLSNQKAGEVANFIVFYAIQNLNDNPTFNGPIVQSTSVGVTVKALAYIGKAANWVAKWFGGDNRRMQGDTAVRRIPVTVGDLAALLLYREEFVQRTMAAIDDDYGMFPRLDDAPMLRGLRKRLQPDVWNDNTAWAQLTVACPPGVTPPLAFSPYAVATTVAASNRCPFNKVLDDDFISKAFKGDARAADRWILTAMGEAIGEYKQAGRQAIKIAKGIADDDIKGLILLLGADCAADIGDTPCGYKALRPLLLPRMMRLADSDDGKRKLWVPDLNARYRLRLLYSTIAAVKAQQLFSSADTAVSMAMASLIALPALSVVGEVVAAGQAADAAAGAANAGGAFARARAIGQFAASAMNAPGANTVIALATEIPEGYRVYRELQFAQGASLVLGQGRLSDALAKKSQYLAEVAATLGLSLLQEIPGLLRLEAEARTARILEDIEARGAAAYKQLAAQDQKAFLRVAADGKILIETGNGAVLSLFDRRAAAAGEKVVVEMGGTVAADENAIARVAATGDPTPHLDRPAIPSTREDPNRLAQTVPDNLGPSADLAKTAQHPPPTPPAEPVKQGPPASSPAETAKEPPPGAQAETAKESPPAGTADTVNSEKAGAGAATVDVPAAAQGEAVALDYPKTLFEGATVPLELRGVTRDLKLGAFLGEGQDVVAFRLANSAEIRGCQDGCVIKFFVKRPAVAKEVIDRIDYISEVLLKKPNVASDILQLENVAFEPNNEFPYIIQKELKRSEDLITIHAKAADVDPAKFKFSTQYFADHEELHDALLGLYRDLVDNGLAWEDGHFGNLYFQKIDGKWKAGILDQDRIIKFNVRDNEGLNFVFSQAEVGYLPFSCVSMSRSRLLLDERLRNEWARLKFGRSFSDLSALDQALFDDKELQNLFSGIRGPNFPDAEFFMEKILEYRGFIRYRDGKFVPGLMKPETVRSYFPKLGEPDRAAPVDLVPGALGSWWHESLLETGPRERVILVFAPRRSPPGQGPPDDLREAA